MTNDEAIQIIKTYIKESKAESIFCPNEIGIEAMEMAVKALETQSRESINNNSIEILKGYRERLKQSVSNQLEADIKAFDEAIEALKAQQWFPKNATNGDMIKTLFPSAEFELNSDLEKTNTGYLTFKGNGFSMCVYLGWWFAPYRSEVEG